MYGVRLAHRPTRADRFKPGRWAHPRPDLSSFHTMSNHTPNGIRAHSVRHTIANEPDNLHTHVQPPRTTPRAHTDRHTITPPGFRIYDKLNLTASIPIDCSAVGRIAPDEDIQNNNLH